MPEDFGSKFTDEETKRLNEKIDKVYREAQADIQRKMDDFNRRYEAKDAMYREMLDNGEITKDQYQSWQRGQVFQGKLWQAKRDQIESVISKANHTSMNIINSGTPSVFAENMNFISYDIEKQMKAEVGFMLADKDTVTRLIKDDPDLLPKWKINEPKDYTWNKQKLGNCVTQGIIQGESLDKIGKRISDGLASSNKNHMMTFARTAMTGAQNAGRQEQMERAEKLGIKVEKQWMATLDSYTRDSHARLDGETVPLKEAFSNDCMYPGDPGGPPAEVYNCRCTMVSEVVDSKSFYSRRDNDSGKVINKLNSDTVANITYEDWKIARKLTDTAKNVDDREHVTDTLKEIAGMGGGTINYELNGHQLTDFKYKSFDSAFRKFYTDVKMTAEKNHVQLTNSQMYRLHDEYANKTTDALRFTNISPLDTYMSDYHTIMNGLKERGFEVIQVKNTLCEIDVPYRGVNTLIQTPKGYTFELQFHTPQSIQIKEVINHPMYEVARKLPDGDPEKARLNEIMKDNMNSIIAPDGIETIKTFKYEKTFGPDKVNQFGW